jgi:hypothetical protein
MASITNSIFKTSMIIINTSQHNGTKIGVNIFYAAPILSGQHIGKFATSENALNEFPEIFKELDYEIAELEPKHFEIDTTPPTPTYKGVIIPEKYSWVFPNNRFELNNFVVEFQTVNNELVVDTSCIFWEAFKTELDKPENITVKASLMPVWDYVVQQIIIDNTIDL